jgi:inorganic pyrophosphatase
MAKNGNNGKGVLANPTRLEPMDADDKQVIQVIIETPKGSRNKYAFDPEQKIFQLKKVLPAGMAFPYDFGFVPSTLADDGDPIDVLVLMDEPAFPGCLLKCRLIGVIEGEQRDKKEKIRNDRIIAIEQANHSFADIKVLDDLGNKFCDELQEFFVNYHRLEGKEFRVLARRGPGEARKLIKAAMK